MIAEATVRQLCLIEHRAIIACYTKWNGEEPCPPELWQELEHHHLLLQMGRDYLNMYYHRPIHP